MKLILLHLRRVRLAAFLVLLCSASWPNSGHASDLNVRDAIFRADINPHQADSAKPSSVYVDFWLSWKNAWNNERNHDAVWMVVKVRGDDSFGDSRVRHARVTTAPEILQVDEQAGTAGLAVSVAGDRTGVFVYPQRSFRGDIRAKLRAHVDASVLEGLAVETIRLEVLAFEMVHIPEGPFRAGAAGEEATEYGAYFRSDGNGRFGGPLPIASEAEITVSPEADALTYRPEAAPHFMGDGQGPSPQRSRKAIVPFTL